MRGALPGGWGRPVGGASSGSLVPLLARQAAVQLLALGGVRENGVRLGDALEEPVRVVPNPLLRLHTAQVH